MQVISEYSGEGVVVFKKFDEGRNNLEGEVTEEGVVSFVTSNALPLVVDFNQVCLFVVTCFCFFVRFILFIQETAQKIFSGDVKSHLLLFLGASSEIYEPTVEIARGIAKDHRVCGISNTCI